MENISVKNVADKIVAKENIAEENVIKENVAEENVAEENVAEKNVACNARFVRVSVIQRSRVRMECCADGRERNRIISLPDRNVLVQNEIDLVWHYIHKKFRRRKETELSRYLLNL